MYKPVLNHCVTVFKDVPIRAIQLEKA